MKINIASASSTPGSVSTVGRAIFEYQAKQVMAEDKLMTGVLLKDIPSEPPNVYVAPVGCW